MTRRRSNSQGNTLIEVVVATVLVGVVLVAALETLGAAARTHRQSATTAEAWTLAERYAAEIMAKPYEDPEGGNGFGPDEGSRSDFDDVDDYHNLYESPPQTASGIDLPGYDGWIVEVIVSLCEASPSDSTISDTFADEGLKRIQVRVSDAAGWVTEFEMLRSRHGFGRHQTPLGLPQVGGVTASVSVAGGAQQLFGDQPLNEAPTP